MARGATFKTEVFQKIMEAFPNSFLTNGGKELRIYGSEDGEEIQIKVALTCAKVNVEHEGAVSTSMQSAGSSPVAATKSGPTPQPKMEPSAEEKRKASEMLARLGLL